MAHEDELCHEKKTLSLEEKQDAILNEMSKSVDRIMNIAENCETELSIHNEMIKELDEEISSAQDNLHISQNKMKRITEFDKRCGLLLLILILIALILFILDFN